MQTDSQRMNIMARLRQSHCGTPCSFLAAEVLEVRALLSAGSAVAGALHHAQTAGAALPAAVVQPATHQSNFQVTVEMPNLSSSGTIQVPGQLSISPVLLKAGSHMSAHVSTSQPLQTATVFVNLSLTAKVQSWVPSGPLEIVTLIPRGSLKLKGVLPSGHVVQKVTFTPNSPLTVRLDQSGAFLRLETNCTHPPINGQVIPPIDFVAFA